MTEPLNIVPIEVREAESDEAPTPCGRDRRALLAEVKRLRAQLAELLGDFDHAYDKWVHGNPAPMHQLDAALNPTPEDP